MAIYFPYLSSFKVPISVKREDIILKSPMEAGYQQTRPRFTKSRKTYDILWDLTEDEVFIFENFFVNETINGALSFFIDFNLANQRINCEVIFASMPELEYNGIGVWELKCSFVEV